MAQLKQRLTGSLPNYGTSSAWQTLFRAMGLSIVGYCKVGVYSVGLPQDWLAKAFFSLLSSREESALENCSRSSKNWNYKQQFSAKFLYHYYEKYWDIICKQFICKLKISKNADVALSKEMTYTAVVPCEVRNKKRNKLLLCLCLLWNFQNRYLCAF